MDIKVIDAADYILSKCGTLSAMKLQKLLYYSQAWHLVWMDKELFSEEIQAWANGPVIPELYKLHRGNFRIEPGFFSGDISRISSQSKEVIDRVLAFYSNKDAQWLSDLTHMEKPWRAARDGLADGELGSNVISTEVIAEYYGSL